MPAADPKHPYLAKKQIPTGSCRQTGNSLILPTNAGSGEIISLQFIGPGGFKRFLAGGSEKDGQFMLGDASGSNPLVVCASFATGASIYEATGWPAVMAFNAGNLHPVAKDRRQKHPHRQKIVAGDKDLETDGNPGLTKQKSGKGRDRPAGQLTCGDAKGSQVSLCRFRQNQLVKRQIRHRTPPPLAFLLKLL